MTSSEMFTLVATVTALLLSAAGILFSGVQTMKAAETLQLTQQLERGNAVIHFTSRFFDLVKDGTPEIEMADSQWATRFWGLHATEFYFFHHSILPTFMYSLWMIDLAHLYSGPTGEKVRESHEQYLRTYSFNYPEMVAFFNEIYETARTCGDENLRNSRVADYVASWITSNKRSRLR
jgi:hypothetical protein